MSDPLLGCLVEIHSVAGIVYEGIIRTIRQVDDLGEIFELGSDANADYQRFICVADRLVQIRPVDWLPIVSENVSSGAIIDMSSTVEERKAEGAGF